MRNARPPCYPPEYLMDNGIGASFGQRRHFFHPCLMRVPTIIFLTPLSSDGKEEITDS